MKIGGNVKEKFQVSWILLDCTLQRPRRIKEYNYSIAKLLERFVASSSSSVLVHVGFVATLEIAIHQSDSDESNSKFEGPSRPSARSSVDSSSTSSLHRRVMNKRNMPRFLNDD